MACTSQLSYTEGWIEKTRDMYVRLLLGVQVLDQFIPFVHYDNQLIQQQLLSPLLVLCLLPV